MKTFVCLYTKHKTQKAKKWQDGFLNVAATKVNLLSENRTFLDSLHLDVSSIGEGSEFEMEKFLVMVEGETNSPLVPPPTAPPDNSSRPTTGEALSKKRPWQSVSGQDLSRQKRARSSDPILEMFQHPANLPSGRRTWKEIQRDLEATFLVSKKTKQEEEPPISVSQSFTPASRKKFIRPKVTQALPPEPKKAMIDGFQFITGKALESFRAKVEKEQRVVIPDSFDSINSYSSTFSRAILEYANLQLLEVSEKYRSMLLRFSSISNGGVMCKHGKPAAARVVKKEGQNKGREFFSCCEKPSCGFFKWTDELSEESKRAVSESIAVSSLSRENIRQLWTSGIRVFWGCELIPPRRKPDLDQSSQNETYLKLPSDWNQKIMDTGVGDIWVISNCPSFDSTKKSKFFLMGKSTSHGPTRNGLLAIEPFSPLKRPVFDLYAIQVTNLRTQLEMMQTLHSLPFAHSSLLAAFTGSDVHSEKTNKPLKPLIKKEGLSGEIHPTLSWVEVQKIGKEIIDRFQLNEDQSQVLWKCASWMTPDPPHLDMKNRREKHCVLVHGVFGSGKSYLLVALVFFLLACSDEDPGLSNLRIFLCAATNVAVDRLLESLLREGFEDFVRVGSLKRISGKILPYSVAGSSSDKDPFKEAVREFKEMLKRKDLSPEEEVAIKKELQSLKEGKILERLDKLKNSKVVGATCAACHFPILNELVFPILFLDESGQMIEPLSLIPMTRFRSERLLCCGDPNQLPPTLKGLKEERTGTNLFKTLYSRLSNLGVKPQMLRTQYRCHPTISALANQLFYQGKLSDGIDGNSRPKILQTFPPIVFFDSDHGKEMVEPSSGSYSNLFEIDVIVRLLQILVALGAKGEEIGVISLYNSQVNQIVEKLRTITPQKLGDTESEDILGELRKVSIFTVDASQGCERNFIIVTTVRTSGSGFMSSPNRINVALTRAKNQLFIIGHSPTLRKDSMWNTILSFISKECQNSVQSGGVFLMNPLPKTFQDLAVRSLDGKE